MGRGRRLALGIFVLLLVDVIWVASSELSEYIFHDTGFDKPFFSTYLKTSMFSLYLLGFIFWSPWRHQCIHNNHDESIYQEVDVTEDDDSSLSGERRLDESYARGVPSSQYSLSYDALKLLMVLAYTAFSLGLFQPSTTLFTKDFQNRDRCGPSPVPIFTVDQLASSVARENDESAQLTQLILWYYLPIQQARTAYKNADQKSEPSYVPLKLQDSQEKSSDGESDDSSVKSVRFSKLTEVRQMSESEAVDAMMSRLSFSASVRAEQLAIQEANKLSVKEVMKISSIFCLLWFAGNYSYQIALNDSEAGIVNIVSSASGLFTLILAAIFPSSVTDKFTLSKLVSVLLMVMGVVLVSLEDISLESSSVPIGVIWSLAGAILYACYMVFLKRKVPSEDRMDFSMFFGFVGFFNAIILWPGFPLLDILGWEKFQLPNLQQLVYMSINGLVGTVLSELLWLWGCFLTSSLMATLSLSLTIPLTMFVDIWLKGIKYSLLIYIGSIPMMVSFIAVTLLTHYENWDPLMDGMKCLHRKFWRRSHMYSLVDTEGLERESLIVNSDDIDEDEEEEEEEEELDTTLISDSITVSNNTTVIISNSSILNNDTATPTSTNNIITNHV